MSTVQANSENWVQIDVKSVDGTLVTCNLYTPQGCVVIAMGIHDYERLNYEGFFIRDGKTRDSAGVLNTTDSYYQQKQ